MKIKNVLKRALSLALAVLMTLSAIPAITTEVSAAGTLETGITGLSASWTDASNSSGKATWSASGNTITGNATGYSSLGIISRTVTTTLELTNNKSESAKLSFDYSLSNGGSVKASVGTMSDGSYSQTLNSGSSVTITLTSPSGQNQNTLSITNLSLVVDVTVTTNFSQPVNGTFTINSNPYDYKSLFTQSSTVPFTLVATPNSGYKFFGWYNETKGEYLSYNSSVSIYNNEDATISAKFIASDIAVFQVGSAKFYDLTEADNNAKSNGKKIVLVEDGKITGSHTISAGNTLLIPFDDAHTLYTNEPGNMGSYIASYIPPEIRATEYVKPTIYKTLTMTEGSNITVNGAISVSAKHKVASGTQEGAGSPSHSTGMIRMNSGSKITLNSGSNLYAWGFITGDGEIDALDGSTIYENFQANDFCGGNATTDRAGDDRGLFPMCQYYVQNIEVLTRYYAGSKEIVYTSFLISGVVASTTGGIVFMGEGGMFIPSTGFVSKKYNGSKDRLILTMHGTASLSPITMSISTTTLESKDFVLPINSNMDIVIAEGANATVNQSVGFLPGSTITVEKGATINISQNTDIIVYDSDEWVGQGYVHAMVDLKPVLYAPGKNYTRTVADLVDVVVDINGTVNSNGGLYTTSGKASVISSEGTGVINMNAIGTLTSTWQAQYYNNQDNYVEIPVTSAQLKNGDGSYTATADDGNAETTNDGAGTYIYDALTDKWVKDDTAVKITYYSNGEEVYYGDELVTTSKSSKVAPNSVLTPPTYTRTGYTLSSWNTLADGKGTAYSGAAVTADMELYAQWTANKYTISYDLDGGTVDVTNPVDYTIESNAITLNNPTKVGYTFAGWTGTDLASATTSVTIAKGSTGDRIYTANWTANKYTVVFNGNSGTGTMNSQSREYDDGIALTENKFSKIGYTFGGWATTADGAKAYDDKSTANLITDKETSVTLYAVWTPRNDTEYTVNYYLQNTDCETYEGISESKTYYGTTDAAINLETVKILNDGFTFSEAKSDYTIIEPDGSTVINLYYTRNKYTITWVDEDGTELDKDTDVPYESTINTYKPTEPTKASTSKYEYSFAGWYNGEEKLEDNTTVIGNVTYKATYTETPVNYTVTWMIDGTKQYTTTTVAYGTAIATPDVDPSKEGYTFDGWDSVPATMPAEDITITAKWTVNTYTIKFDKNADDATGTAMADLPMTYGEEKNLTANTYSRTGYTFGGWSYGGKTYSDGASVKDLTADNNAVVTLKAIWTLNSYTIAFYEAEGDSHQIDSKSYNYGTTIDTTSVSSQIINSNAGHTFAGWTLTEGSNDAVSSVVDGKIVIDVTALVKTSANGTTFKLYPVWEINQYTITFNTDGGSTIGAITADYGDTVTAPADPTKTGYTFAGWVDEDGNAATIPESMPAEDITLKATWTINQYTITFENTGDVAYEAITQNYGTDIAAIADPVKTGYKFDGWTITNTDTGAAVEAPTTIPAYNVTYTANWTINTYTVTWVDENGTELEKDENVPYGTVPTYDKGTPTKPATAQYTYTFAGWDKEIVAVTGDVTYKATYSFTVNEYTVTWLDDDGTELEKDENVPYDTVPTYDKGTPTKPATAQYTYTFAGWDKEIVAVTGDVTYKATYSSTVNKYTVTWVNEDGTEIYSAEVEYGTTPSYDGDIPTKPATAQYTYTFAGWDKEIVAVIGDVTYTATYSSTVIKYAITWIVDGTSTTTTVAYDETPVYEGTPAKAEDDKYTYTFTGWSPEIAPVTGEATYTAQFSKTAINYTITYNLNDGTVDGTNPISYNVETETFVLINPVRIGYNFAGWTGTGLDGAQTTVTIPAESIGDREYTATWTPVVYDITYDLGEGSLADGVTNPASYTIESETITLNNPTKEGYTFAGWTGTGLDGAQTTVTIPAESIGNREYTATWTVNSYTVTWDVDGAETEETYAYGAAITAPADPTKLGYTFTGWTPAVAATMPAEDVTYTATWTVNKYTVTWTNGTTVMSTTDQLFGSVIGKPADPAKTGHTFLGWAFTADATEAVYKAGEDVTVDADIANNANTDNEVTLYAVFSINSYTVTWDIDGAETEETYAHGATITIPENPTKTGYTFTGWAITNTDTGATVSSAPTRMPEYNVTFTATWRLNEYTITWKVDDVEDAVTYNHGDTIVAPADPTKESTVDTVFAFSHWSGFTSGMTATENKEFVAVFAESIRQYTISFNANGGSSVSSITDDYNNAITLPDASSSSKIGYTLIGWSDGTTTYNVGGEYTIAGDATLTAVWDANEYTITFNTDGGSEVASITADYGTSISAPTDPTKMGYTFAGWYNGETKVEIFPSVMPLNGMTLKAKWTINSYTVTWNVDGTETEVPYAYGAEITAPADPSKTGHTFAGWSPAVAATMPANDVTYTATWTVNSYTVTWKVEGAEDDVDTYEYGKTIVAPANPEKEGHTFAGWTPSVAATMPAENVTYTATWNVNSYTVTWNVDGTETEVTYAYGAAITAPADPSKTGHTFAGWSPAVAATMPANDVTYTATWTVNSYTMKWDVDGVVTEKTYAYGTTIPASDIPAHDKDGFNFGGWTLTKDSDDVYHIGTMPAENITLYPIWTSGYVATFISDEASVAGYSKAYTTGDTIDKPTLTKTGHTFAGWIVTKTGTTEIVTEPTVMPEYNVTFTAKWTPITYTITFDANGGEGSTASKTGVNYDEDVALTANGFTREGYTFMGWATSESGSKVYSDKDSVKNLTTADGETVTLYAVWQINQYTITFANTGDAAYEAITQDYGSNIAPIANPIKTGYTFAGWDVKIPSTMPAGDMIITASWTINQYTITFDTDGGSEIAPITQDYNTAVTAPADPTKTGYKFDGWDTTVPSTMPAQSITIKAKWTINQYTITFNTDGGTEIGAITADYGDTVTAPADPTKTGYTFAGWDATIPATMPAENVTITANWNINQYTITFANTGDTTIAPIKQDYNTTVTAPAAPTKTGYTFAGWDAEIPATMPAGDMTITAQWTINQYTITFANTGDTTIAPIKQDYNTAVTAPADPTKTGYTFAGWDKSIPSTMPAEDMTITASWTANEYDLVWVYDNGDENSTVKVAYGAEIAEPTEPTKAGHTFAGWYNGDTEVTFPINMPLNGITLTAKWTINTYTVKWVNAGGNVIETDENVPYGTMPQYDGSTPTKAPDAQYTYTFDKWVNAETEADMAAVSGDVTYKPTFKTTTNTYTVTWIDGNGEVFSKQENVPYGTVITLPDGTPVKDATTEQVFAFESWGGFTDGMTVDGNETFTAEFTPSARPYTITWVDGDGEILDTDTVAYGDTPVYTGVTPTKTATAKYTYTFNNSWSPAIVAVTGDATYTAQFDSEVNKYTITWVVEGVETTKEVAYGEIPVFDGTPTKADAEHYTYQFASWTPEVVSVTGEATYTAVFTEIPNKYTITFDMNGGNAIAPITEDYGTKINLPNASTATRTGYVLGGWTEFRDYYYYDYGAGQSYDILGNSTLTASWTPNTYSVKLDANGGLGDEMSTLEKTYGQALVLTENTYTREGYEFLGWSVLERATEATYADGATLNVDLTAENGETVTIYAVWKIQKYTITFVDTGDVAYEAITQDYGTAIGAVADPVKTGYTFVDWDATIPATMPASNVTITARWTINSYDIKWVDGLGNTLKTETLEYNASTAGLTAPVATREGYTFAGWDVTVPATMPASNVTITANWNINQYTITFADTGDVAYEAITQDYGTDIAPIADPVKTGYTFAGWDVAVPATMPAGDMTITAQWTVNAYTISFNTNGGSEVESITKNYGEDIGTVTAPEKVGYTFAGWTLNGSEAELPEKMPAESRTYVATWTANTDTKYTVVHWFQKLGVYATEKNGTNFLAEVTETLYGTTGEKIQAQRTFDGFTAITDTKNYTIAADGSTVVNYYYTRNTYWVEFDYQNGKGAEGSRMQFGAIITAPATVPTKEPDVDKVYTFEKWVDEADETKALESGVTTVTGTVTYVPVFTDSPREYVITWVDGNGDVLGTDNVAYGETPVYAGETPTKTATKQYSYIFNNTWSPAIAAVTGTATYTAQFDSKDNEYTITWVDDDGETVLSTTTVKYGEMPAFDKETPVKTADAQYTYTFSGWVDKNDTNKTVTAVTDDATYKAVYSRVVNSYTVIWTNYDGTTLETDTNVSYGATPVFNKVNPQKPATDKHTYTFIGWSPEVSSVTGDVTYTAQFSETVNKYQIGWLNHDGTVIYTEDVEYDALPAYDFVTYGTPAKDATAEFTYVHSGWTPEVTTVTGDATHTAKFDEIRNSYTVTWLNEDGTPLEVETVLYGDTPTYDGLTPTKAADVQYTYTFAGWDKEIVTVTGDVTYTATYLLTVNKYKITWVVEGVETTKEVEFGTVPMYGETADVKPSKANTAEHFYSFKEWTPAVIAVAGDATYTAVFDPIPVNYTITFNTDGGTAIAPITRGFGLEVPDVSDPTKTGYTFIGWDKEIPETMPAENVTITALWQINQYTITFDSNGGSDVAPITQDYDTVVNAPEVPTYYGYDFNGWYLDGAKVEFPMNMPAEDITLKAEWTLTKYTITWVDGDGNTIKEDTVNHGTIPSYVGNEPTKATDAKFNYKFTGWSPSIVEATANATYTAQFEGVLREYRIGWDIDGDGIEDDATYVSYGTVPTHTDGVKTADEQYEYKFTGWVDKNGNAPAAVTGVALYSAQFTPVPVEYTITLDPDGGAFADGSTELMEITAGFGTTITEPTAPTKTGYSFLYWMDDNGNESFVPDTMPVGGKTLKAKWAVNSYTITFVTGDGATAVAPITKYYGENVGTVTEPTREGYTFAGWDTAVPGTMPAGDMVITAKWTVNNYTLSFVDADGTPISSKTLDYGASIGVIDTPVKAGYDFTGWVDEFGTPAIIPATMPAQNLTYTATWTPKQFMVAYYDDGELVSTGYVFCGSELVPPAEEPTKTGHTFAGWVISGTNQAMPETMPANDLILEASWSVGLYTLTFLDDDGGNVIYTAQVEYGAEIVPPATPTREGYTFRSWRYIRATMPAKNLTVYAQWNANVYTITFYNEDGTVISAVTRAYGQSVTAPTAPAKNGYTFAGWIPAVPATMPVDGGVITATYTANEYKITFNTNGGSAVADIVALCDEPIVAPADPVRDGYIFVGWDAAIPATMPAGGLTLNAQWTPSHYAINWDTDGDGDVDDTTDVAVGETPVHADGEKTATAEYSYVFAGWTPSVSPVTGTVTYTATFTAVPNNYTLAFDTDGGSAVESLTLAYGSAIDLSAVVAPTKEGYTFTGWGTVPETMPAQNVTLVAQWKANEYTITFDTADGSVVAPITVSYGDRISKPVDPERTGYTFAGWSVDGITAVEFPETMPAGGLNLKALWTVKQFTITYVVDGNTEYVKYTVDFGAAVTQPTDPAKADYTFIGWNPAVPATMPANDVTVVAQWKVNEYTITFDADGGSEVASITAGYGYNISEPNAPTKEGYAFTGWSVDGINAIEFPETMPSGGLNLKALWTVMQYTITFDTADGTAVAPITVNYGDEITKPVDPTRTGYTFAGWSVDGTTAVEFPETMPAGGLSLKALWTVKQFTITYVVDDNAEYSKYTIDFGAIVSKPADPTKADYTFTGWTPAVPETMPAQNVTVTAQFRYSYTGWKTTEGGTTYYVDGAVAYVSTWQTIEDKDYYFDENGYVVKGVTEVPSKDGTYTAKFIFDETTGAFDADYSGLYDHGADTYMAENGEIKNTEGLVRIVKPDGEVNYYYFVGGKAVKGTTASVENTNGLLLPTNNYTFDEFGVILHDEDTSKNGKITEADGVTYYYVDGVKAYMGLVFDGEYYYYFNDEGVMVADGKYEVIRTNDLLPADTYRFDKQGRLTFVLRGDLDDDGDVDKNDAIYCLYTVLFGEVRYPRNQDIDFNLDGSSDKNDAIYLLYHALFGGERYPLS